MKRNYPNHWVITELENVGKLTAGNPAPQEKQYFTNGITPFVRVADLGQLGNSVYIHNTKDKINKKLDNRLKLYPKGSVLFTKSGMSLLLNQRAILGSDMYVVSHIGIVVPTQEISGEWIYYWLKTIDFKKYAHATTLPSLKISLLRKMDFPLPPLNEQNCIVEKIEELLSDLDKANEELKKTQEQLKIYRQAVLKAAFEGKLTEEWRGKNSISPAKLLFKRVFNKRKEIYKKQQFKKCKKLKPPEKFYKKENITEIKLDAIPDTWKQIKFIDLIKYEENAIKRGPFGSAIKKVYFVPKGYKVYEQKNAINDDVILGNYFIDEAKYKELERFSVKGGDYIISCSGTIGRISKLPKDASIGVINQALLKIVLDEDLFIDKLFLYLFRAEFFQRKILKKTRGSAMKNIASVEDIKNINVLLPSKKEQEQMLQEIESRLSVCDKLEETVNKSLEKIKYLRQSILKKAFEGKLVPQWPDLPAPQPGKYWVYVIKCNNDSNYIGFTSNLRHRWEQHLSGEGAEWTKKHKPQYIMYWEEFDNKADAIIREDKLKTGYGRKWIKREEKQGRLWRAGESAEKLLERIKQEKQKFELNKKKRK